jgi:glycolate oxidase
MALPRDVYRELEDILGPENISEDPAVLDAYAYFGAFMLEPSPRPEERYLLRPEAVVLPGSTKEVQAVIKLCNRRGIKFRAVSTGYGPWNAASSEGEIILDLRRMNRILEIDEKNMYIVVEPYVSFAQVQAEAHKRGLNCHVVGAGSTCSFLASHTSVDGNNTQGISQGYSGRNLLAFEWVLPTGEILRSGSLGSGAGWFSGDGPGPSLRGITRGIAGSRGGIGVFTKCAAHLHPWPGPAEMEIKGISPYYETELLPNFEYHIIGWPSWEQCAEFQYKIGGAKIAYAAHKTGGPGSHGATVTGSNNEYYEKWEELKELPEVSFAVVLAANSPREHEYQVKVLNKILAETGGKILPIGEKPIFKKRDLINMIKGCFIPRSAFRPTGTFAVDGLVGTDTVDHAAMALKIDGPRKDKYAEKGVLADDGTYNSWQVPYEGAHLALFECGHFAGPEDEESCRGMLQMIEEGVEMTLKTPLALNWMAAGPFLKVYGPACGNFQNWMRKIKKAFDPNDAADPSWYISGKVE